LDFFRVVRLPAVVAVLGLLAKSGESNSKLGPPDGVLDPVLDGESIDASLNGESIGDASLERSVPVTASEMARKPPKFGFRPALFVQSTCIPWRFDGEVGEAALADRTPVSSSFVTVGEGASIVGAIGRMDSVVLVEAVRRCGPVAKP
jgi:hypothetical protein